MHGVHWLAEKSEKSLRLLFIKQYMNSSRKSHKRVQKKKKKKKRQTQALGFLA